MLLAYQRCAPTTAPLHHASYFGLLQPFPSHKTSLTLISCTTAQGQIHCKAPYSKLLHHSQIYALHGEKEEGKKKKKKEEIT